MSLMSITSKIAGVVLAGVVTLGGTTAALAGGKDDGTTSTRRTDRIAAICEHKDEIVAKLTERQTRLNERLTKLTKLRATAETAGRERAVARIDKWIDRLNERIELLGQRIVDAPNWIAEHCS